MSGRVIVLGGPTAAGKSAAALDLAEALGAVIVCADAMTVFRGLDVGTAKPTAADRARVPHFGLDTVDPPDEWSVADFVAEVEAVRAVHPRVLVVGGTPFWLRALVHPLARLPPGDPVVRAAIEAREGLHDALAAVDPVSAARLHPNDRVRIVRALEVHALTGQSLSALHAAGAARPPLADGVVWLDHPELRARIDARLDGMLAGGGYRAEAEAALAAHGAEARALRSFAYSHIVAWIQGRLGLEDARAATARDTWVCARKQRTWARSQGWAPLDAAGAAAQVRSLFGV